MIYLLYFGVGWAPNPSYAGCTPFVSKWYAAGVSAAVVEMAQEYCWQNMLHPVRAAAVGLTAGDRFPA